MSAPHTLTTTQQASVDAFLAWQGVTVLSRQAMRLGSRVMAVVRFEGRVRDGSIEIRGRKTRWCGHDPADSDNPHTPFGSVTCQLAPSLFVVLAFNKTLAHRIEEEKAHAA